MRSLFFCRHAGANRVVRSRLVLQLCVGLVALMALPCHAAAQSAVPFGRVRTLQVDSMGEGTTATAIRQRVIDRLNKSGRLKVVENSSAADASLRGTSNVWVSGTISLSPRSNSAIENVYQAYLSIELVDTSGQILWSYLVTPSRFHTASIADDLADQAVMHLLDAIRSGEAGSVPPVGAAPRAQVELHSAGSTLAAPIYMAWFQSSGMKIAYDAIGSEEGIEELAKDQVDFAGSDMPLFSESTPPGLHVLQIATVVGGVVPIYNLPQAGRTLRFTPQVLAGIYSGAIRKWNDPRIAQVNHGAHLPDAEIAVVHRSDGSGTTYVWTSFLSLASPEWKASAGSGPRVNWPVGTGAAGNGGVAEMVEKTTNSIGYVELIYAIQHELNFGSVRNPAGEFIKADLANITAAAASATAQTDQDFRFSILNAPGSGAYPISTFTWLLLPDHGLGAQKRSAIADFLEWALTSGQKECASLGYAPLPRQLTSRELTAVNAWKSHE
jgi:phosphate ABC transporter phosphate-binding protein